MEVEGFHIGVSDLDAFRVGVGIQLALDSKSGFGCSRCDQLNNGLVTDERPPAPVSVMNEKSRCSILFHLLVPGGR